MTRTPKLACGWLAALVAAGAFAPCLVSELRRRAAWSDLRRRAAGKDLRGIRGASALQRVLDGAADLQAFHALLPGDSRDSSLAGRFVLVESGGAQARFWIVDQLGRVVPEASRVELRVFPTWITDYEARLRFDPERGVTVIELFERADFEDTTSSMELVRFLASPPRVVRPSPPSLATAGEGCHGARAPRSELTPPLPASPRFAGGGERRGPCLPLLSPPMKPLLAVGTGS